MHRTSPEGAALARELAALSAADPASATAPVVVLCPAAPALESVSRALSGSGMALGAQNLHPEPQGAYTGEVSGSMLRAAGCTWVIVGHSERRHGMGETDALVAAKLRAAQRDGLVPIVCVGETLAERERGLTEEVLVRQVTVAYHGLATAEARGTAIAYEPVWAIGTGKVATPEQARDARSRARPGRGGGGRNPLRRQRQCRQCRLAVRRARRGRRARGRRVARGRVVLEDRERGERSGLTLAF